MRVSAPTALIFFLVLSNGWSQTTSSSGQASTPPDGTQTTSAPAPAPQSAAAATPAPPPPANAFSTSSVRLGGIDFSGMFDGYYSFNDNHPAAGYNNLYNFNDLTDQVDLNLLKLTVSRDPDPVGFRVDVGLGRAMEIMHSATPDPEAFRFIEQAYVSLKPKGWRGFEADFGDFVTSAGAEVIESRDNWNYSRSLLFALAVPYYHFGIRTSMPINSSITVGVQVVDGWNEIVDQHGNNMQTVGLTGAITRKKFTWSNNYYVGPQWTATTTGNRNLYDTTLLLTPTDKFNAYVNFDYGQQHAILSGLNHWEGIAAAAHYQVTKRIALSPRFEYYDDATGFTTGVKQKLHEITITGEYKMLDGLLARLEFRHDGSNVPYFDHGLQNGVSQTQTTATVGLIAFFPVKH
ncbi:MAG: porin [Acidobacteriaceae bacterium]|nr:porin [Acidobacteriaceae bacterium]MBV9501343.1 porin [Acidobacteriaceae bacterium]